MPNAQIKKASTCFKKEKKEKKKKKKTSAQAIGLKGSLLQQSGSTYEKHPQEYRIQDHCKSRKFLNNLSQKKNLNKS